MVWYNLLLVGFLLHALGTKQFEEHLLDLLGSDSPVLVSVIDFEHKGILWEKFVVYQRDYMMRTMF